MRSIFLIGGYITSKWNKNKWSQMSMQLARSTWFSVSGKGSIEPAETIYEYSDDKYSPQPPCPEICWAALGWAVALTSRGRRLPRMEKRWLHRWSVHSTFSFIYPSKKEALSSNFFCHARYFSVTRGELLNRSVSLLSYCSGDATPLHFAKLFP